MYWQRACNGATVTLILAGAALAQSDGSGEYPLAAPCWQTCVNAQRTQCSSTETDLSCLYQVASNPALRPALQSCLELFCDALNAKSMVQYLSQVSKESGPPTLASVSEEDALSIARQTVTATGLTRAHRNMPRSMTSEPTATVTAITAPQSTDGSTAATGNASANTSTSPASSRSSSAAGPKATQNGGTVLDQAGSTGGANTILQAGSLVSMTMGVGCLVVGLNAWLW